MTEDFLETAHTLTDRGGSDAEFGRSGAEAAQAQGCFQRPQRVQVGYSHEPYKVFLYIY